MGLVINQGHIPLNDYTSLDFQKFPKSHAGIRKQELRVSAIVYDVNNHNKQIYNNLDKLMSCIMHDNLEFFYKKCYWEWKMQIRKVRK
jgi:hypothetical protein